MSAKEKEIIVRKIMSQKYGVEFAEKNVCLEGTNNQKYRFDLVSPDGTIVGEIKTSAVSLSLKRKPHSKIAHVSEACLFLMHAKDAKQRILVLTDENFYNIYIEERQAQMVQADGIEIMTIMAK